MEVLITTVEREIYRGRASMVIAPSAGGEIAILPGHAPLLAILRPGEIRVDCPVHAESSECHSDNMVVFGGYIEVQPNRITILADGIERAADIDEAQAKYALKQAKEMLNSPDKDKASRALVDLDLAIAKLQVLRRNSKHSLIKP
ncbi:ATP synthase F1 subunit epsilon [Mariprofundus sp. EBB-1]|uniref:ATP synthase F1 subunit epsilon n=1 Tax=Mariprofundus sp. EBB-1 TaxID=2650971 RepID=UPI00137AF91E|nr:ATP synthase F1 subunit epsilon [Mariprofundus sp. EBB-1]